MSTAPSQHPVSIADYLAGEADARNKHEYVTGSVYAMVGASNRHNRIATNTTVAFGSQLRGNECQTFNSDTKVRIQLKDGVRFYYPDVMVACDVNPDDDTFQDKPVVIVEVLSESTHRTDKNEKRDAYLTIESLNCYIMLEQSEIAATVYRRATDGFACENYSSVASVIEVPEINCSLSLAEVYANVSL